MVVGSSAGALIGLQFVVMTLIAQRPSMGSADASAAFGTPTVFHFASVLFLSALLCAPWQNVAIAIILCGLIGLNGVLYSLVVARRMRTQTAYQPVFEDWLFHLVLPLAAYGILALSMLAAASRTRPGIFAIGGAALLLLFIGIHNTWDALSYHILVRMKDKNKEQSGEQVSKQ